MSDSDDTDVLLLIPPDLFIIPSSDSEDSVYHASGKYGKTGVVSEILEHVQSLESRISAIESRDNSIEISLLNGSVDSQIQAVSYPITEISSTKEISPCAVHTRCQLFSLPNTPAKPLHCSSAKSSPGSCRQSIVTNTKRNEMRLGRHVSRPNVTNNKINSDNARIWKKHDDLTASGRSLAGVLSEVENTRISSSAKDSRQSVIVTPNLAGNKEVGEMELSEVDELLQDMEATEIELAKRINSSNAHRYSEELQRSKDFCNLNAGSFLPETKSSRKIHSPMRRLDFQFADEESHTPFDSLNLQRDTGIEVFTDVSLPDEDALQMDDNGTMISAFKPWRQSAHGVSTETYHGLSTNVEKPTDNLKLEDGAIRTPAAPMQKLIKDDGTTNRRMVCGSPSKIVESRVSRSSETSDVETHAVNTKSSNCQSLPNIKSSINVYSVPNDNGKSHTTGYSNDKTNDTVDSGLQGTRQSQCTNELQQTIREIRMTGHPKIDSPLARNNETCPRKSQRLLTLSDFWHCDGTKSQEEMLRIRLEEEKFRREHCEHVIQELQKRLLEQQEKVAVAIRVDNEKNSAILQFQNAWSKLKQRWDSLEKEHAELETTLKSVTEKHKLETTEYQQQIKRGESELSKALDLAAGYKEKSDSLVKEKLELLKSHADELEKYKSLVQEAEQRYENLKSDYGKLMEKSKQLEEIGNNAQQELNKERTRSAEVRSEMVVIHKALDACEAELIILRQEKESLQLKLKEEVTRNGMLVENKVAMLEAINDAKNAEKTAKDETKSFIDRQEQIRSELREVYQNQVDEVVKTKLKEFQEQLDAAEMAFHADLETRQRAIAECAARKIKSIIDKHQLEINLLEEKHKEEKRMGEIQLAQATQKVAMLETHLSTQRATKTHLAEQLHSVMQKQWQQALHIISGGHMENLSPLQRLNAERIFETKVSKRCISACCNKDRTLVKPELRSASSHNLQSTNSRHEQDSSLITLTSNDETPVTRKEPTNYEPTDDVRKFIKMLLDRQQPKEDFLRAKYIEENNSSPPPVSREVPRKHYMKKENDGLSEESVTWQRADEHSIQDTSEYMQIPQTQATKSDQQRSKPPWK